MQWWILFTYEFCTGLFLPVMFCNSHFSIINNCCECKTRASQIRLELNPPHQSLTPTFSSVILSIYKSLFFLLLFAHFSISFSVSLIPLCVHNYFVFLYFEHLLLNHNHRSSRMFSWSFAPITAQLCGMNCNILTNVKHECWVGGYYGVFMFLLTAFHMKKFIISENSSMLFCFQSTRIVVIRNNEGKKNSLKETKKEEGIVTPT